MMSTTASMWKLERSFSRDVNAQRRSFGIKGEPIRAETIKALAYVRVSSKEQKKEGLSIPAQRKALQSDAANNRLACRRMRSGWSRIHVRRVTESGACGAGSRSAGRRIVVARCDAIRPGAIRPIHQDICANAKTVPTKQRRRISS
jgi:hypothetical protein